MDRLAKRRRGAAHGGGNVGTSTSSSSSASTDFPGVGGLPMAGQQHPLFFRGFPSTTVPPWTPMHNVMGGAAGLHTSTNFAADDQNTTLLRGAGMTQFGGASSSSATFFPGSAGFAMPQQPPAAGPVMSSVNTNTAAFPIGSHDPRHTFTFRQQSSGSRGHLSHLQQQHTIPGSHNVFEGVLSHPSQQVAQGTNQDKLPTSVASGGGGNSSGTYSSSNLLRGRPVAPIVVSKKYKNAPAGPLMRMMRSERSHNNLARKSSSLSTGVKKARSATSTSKVSTVRKTKLSAVLPRRRRRRGRMRTASASRSDCSALASSSHTSTTSRSSKLQRGRASDQHHLSNSDWKAMGSSQRTAKSRRSANLLGSPQALRSWKGNPVYPGSQLPPYLGKFYQADVSGKQCLRRTPFARDAVLYYNLRTPEHFWRLQDHRVLPEIWWKWLRGACRKSHRPEVLPCPPSLVPPIAVRRRSPNAVAANEVHEVVKILTTIWSRSGNYKSSPGKYVLSSSFRTFVGKHLA
ncbi:unnamed protein product [Amoebophrya sp. A25]|nr:unnamed protein product [Amoebophrya sp. A25]|eukprot:GSA25T00011657001.1